MKGATLRWVEQITIRPPLRSDPSPSGPETGKKRVIRGGAWNGSYATWLRPSFRYAQDPNARSHGIGFRCAAKPTF